MPAIAPSWRTSKPSVRWEWITPLGFRVVPEVNPMTAGESGSVGERGLDRLGLEQLGEVAGVTGKGLALGADDEPRCVRAARGATSA